MKKGQTTIELLMILAISLVALAVIYSIYSDQLGASNYSKEASVASSTLRRMVNAADSLYISGAGSKTRILVEIPRSVNMEKSKVSGKTLLLELSGGTDVFQTADVNFNGDWKKLHGDYVLGSYYATLEFDGNSVNISYDDFELSNSGLSFAARAGSLVRGYFSVRNASNEGADFWLGDSFSSLPSASLALADDDLHFSLGPNESRRIDFNILLGESAGGDYAGYIDVNGRINDGVSDYNVAKQVSISVEAYNNKSEVELYPKSTFFNADANTIIKKSFLICNATQARLAGIGWSRDSNANANMLGWFDWPPKDNAGNEILTIQPDSCASFDLNFSIPLGAQELQYDANFTATLPDGNSSAASVFVSVLAAPVS